MKREFTEEMCQNMEKKFGTDFDKIESIFFEGFKRSGNITDFEEHFYSFVKSNMKPKIVRGILLGSKTGLKLTLKEFIDFWEENKKDFEKFFTFNELIENLSDGLNLIEYTSIDDCGKDGYNFKAQDGTCDFMVYNKGDKIYYFEEI